MSTLLCGDCREVLKAMEPNSIDAIVTDPPAGISFMSKSWDSDKGGRDQWIDWLAGVMRECYRVAKPGAYAFVWALPRTSGWTHRALEDGGWQVVDCVTHLFGSGFPKHKSKLKPAAEFWYLAWKPDTRATPLNVDACRIGGPPPSVPQPDFRSVNGRATHLDAHQRNGEMSHATGRWPANVALGHHEDCVPTGTKRVKSDGARPARRGSGTKGYHGWPNGTDDGERIEFADADGTETVAAWECHPDCAVALLDAQSGELRARGNIGASKGGGGLYGHPQTVNTFGAGDTGGASRFFLNVAAWDCHPDCAVAALDAQSGGLRARGNVTPTKSGTSGIFWGANGGADGAIDGGDTGGASRFFYVAKASRRERSAGLASPSPHPTVKPIALMRWLVRLVAPPGGVVLDPFCGSGTTGCAAAIEGVTFIGIEMSEEYIEIARRRIAHWTEYGEDALKSTVTVRPPADDVLRALPLFAGLAAD